MTPVTVTFTRHCGGRLGVGAVDQLEEGRDGGGGGLVTVAEGA
jgi:hypothetical protein